jgi:hypothetical protein
MLKICDALSINVIDTRKQDQLIEQYATRALEQAKWDKSDDFPLEQGFELLVHLFYKDGAIDSRGDAKACDWQKKRSAEAKLWASFWQKLERSIDADWNVRDRPMLSVPPPNGSKDPNVLAEYNAEVEKNAGKTRKYNQQYKLRKLQKQFLPKAEKYFIRAYSLPPSNIDELRQYLADIADTSSKERILTTVTGVRSAGP